MQFASKTDFMTKLLLSNNALQRLARKGAFVIQIITKNMNLLLTNAFNEVRNKKAEKILLTDNKEISDSIIDSEEFPKVVEFISCNDHRRELLINLIERFLKLYPNRVSNVLNVFDKLLPYAGDFSVYEFFKRFLVKDLNPNICQYLKEIDFIVKVMEKYENEKDNMEKSKSYFVLMKCCFQVPSLPESKEINKIIPMIEDCFIDPNIQLKLELWELIISTSQIQPKSFQDFLFNPIDAIEVKNNRFDQYQVKAIDFLVKMIDIDKTISTLLNPVRFAEMIIDIFVRFPGHSICLVSLCELV
jgi:hypothetical protein